MDCSTSQEIAQSKSNKNAFKIAAKGFRATACDKKELKDEYGCRWNEDHKAWSCPIENKLLVMRYLEERPNPIKAQAIDIIDLGIKMPITIYDMETRQWRLQKEIAAEEKTFLVEVYKFDKTLGPEHFDREPIRDEYDSDQRHKMALELHKQGKALKDKKDEAQNLLNSIKGHQNEASPLDAVVDELNKVHAVVHTDQTYILTEKVRPGGKGLDFTLESRQSLINLYENQSVDVGAGKRKTKGKIWLEHPNRRQYQGITFDPTTEGHTDGYYNIWRGFSIEARKGHCERFKEHIRDVICAGNEDRYRYLWQWCSHLVQHPDKNLPALLLMSSQGTGKNTFVDAFGRIFGPHYLPLDSMQQLLGNFNFHHKNAVLIHGNEALWGGNKKDLGKLKAMITEEYCCIEGKGKDVIQIRNFRHLILSSNEDWPVHLDRDDRRFIVFQVGETRKEDPGYFKAIKDEMQAGGHEAFLYELLGEDLSGFNPHNIPNDSEAFNVKLISAPSVEQYIYEALSVGCFDLANATRGVEGWRVSISRDSVYVDYKGWCESQGNRQMESKEALGRALSKLIPSISESRPAAASGVRARHYDLPSLARAREEFQRVYKSGNDIWKS